MKVLIDIGNSSVKLSSIDNGGIGVINCCDTNNLIYEIKRLYGTDISIVLSSVRQLEENLITQLKEISKSFIQISAASLLPIQLNYKTPHTLGADRIAAAVGANTLFPDKDCIIFDFGTAITIDFVTKNGIFNGGNISLGLDMRFRALNEFTSKLPLLQAPDLISNIGNSTNEAIASGVVLGIMFEVQSYIAKYPDNVIIFTGGDAFYFAEKMKKPIFVILNLILIGMSVISDIKDNE